MTTVAPKETSLELQERMFAQLVAERDKLTGEIDRLVTEIYHAERDAVIEDPMARFGSAVGKVGQMKKRLDEKERERCNVINELTVREPLLAELRRRDAEEKSAGLIRRTREDINSARKKIEADIRVLVEDWNGLYCEGVERADRTTAFTPDRPEYRDLLRFVTDHIGEARRPHAKRLHDVLLGRSETPEWAFFGEVAPPVAYSYRARAEAGLDPWNNDRQPAGHQGGGGELIT
jgi:hypothetical protein